MTKTGRRKAGRRPKLVGQRSKAFDAAIRDDLQSDAEIASDFGVSERTVVRRRAEIFATVAKKRDIAARQLGAAESDLLQLDPQLGAQEALQRSAESLEANLCRLIEHADRMLVAADEWLRDPDDRSKYFLGPRTTEVVVDVYDSLGRKVDPGVKRTLAELLAEARKPAAELGRTVELREAKYADPRKLLLEAVATLKPVVEVLGKARGELKDGAQININTLLVHPGFVLLRDALAEWAATLPEGLREQLKALLAGREWRRK